ncbi:MAG TPA: hypothetical protein VHY37_02865 [Tepidisphaeraceae bacterium]|jgi:hypothetical protein|nr:hypothetical protein [Tepidisphaeraceae bacterium]
MLLQTNSYVVPRDRKAEHARLVRRFRQTFGRLGCDTFEVYEQVGSNWSAGESSGRFVQIMRFSDRRHQLAVQEAERNDPDAQSLIAEFCDLINFPYQRQQGLFAVGFYISVLPSAARRQPELLEKGAGPEGEIEEESAQSADADADATKAPPRPSKPPALVEPGAATRAPIVPPVAPGQVAIITPAPTEAHEMESTPTEPEPQQTGSMPQASADDSAEAAAALDSPVDDDQESTLASSDFEDISDLDDPSEPAIADAPAAELDEESVPAPVVSPTANPRWQTTADLDDEVEGDVTTDLTDTDDNGQVRVADDDLLKAESDFAEYTAEPISTFDEIPAKAPVLEGTLVDDHYGGEATPVVPMNDDDALEALEMPLANSQSVEQAHIEKEIKQLAEEPVGEIDDLEPLPDPTEEKSAK